MAGWDGARTDDANSNVVFVPYASILVSATLSCRGYHILKEYQLTILYIKYYSYLLKSLLIV